MEAHDAYTRLLGLALRGGNLVTGSDATRAAAYAGKARLLLLSADASVRTCKDAELWAGRGNCLLIALPCDKAELGGALGRGSVAVAALTDAGLAAAVGERLALYDADRYGAVAERLRVKSKRAVERRKARARPDAPRKPKSAASRKRDEKQGTESPVALRRGGGKGATTPRKHSETPPPRRRDGTASRKEGANASRAVSRRPLPPKGAAPRKREASPRKPGPRKNPNAKK